VRQLDDQIAAQRDEIAAAAALLQAAHQEAGALRQDDSANMSESRIPGYDPGEKIQRLNGQPAAPRFAGFSLIPPPADGGGLGSSRQPAGQHAALRRQLLQLDAELENVQAVKAAAKAKAEALAAENQEVSRRIVDLDADLRNAQVPGAETCATLLWSEQQGLQGLADVVTSALGAPGQTSAVQLSAGHWSSPFIILNSIEETSQPCCTRMLHAAANQDSLCRTRPTAAAPLCTTRSSARPRQLRRMQRFRQRSVASCGRR